MTKLGGSVLALLLVAIIAFIAYRLGLKKQNLQPQKLTAYLPNHPHPMFLKLLHVNPHILQIENFLSSDECGHLIDLAKSRYKRSTVQSLEPTEDVNRTSFTSNLLRSQTPTVSMIEQRATNFTLLPLTNIEPLQIVRYEPGQFYRAHYDFFEPSDPQNAKPLARGGQRMFTFFVYLNDIDDGSGCTRFPRLDLKVNPQEGKAIFWRNVNGEGEVDMKTFHGGEPPDKHVKYGLNIWIRTNTFI